MPKVFVEAHALTAPRTGVGTYTASLVSAIADRFPSATFVIGVMGREEPDLSGLPLDRCLVHRNSRISRRAFRSLLALRLDPSVETVFPGHTFDAYLFPGFMTMRRKREQPSLTIVHDAIVRTHPKDKSWWSRTGFALMTQRSLDQAPCATVSNSARDDIEAHFRVNQLSVLYPISRPRAARHGGATARRKPFLLCVGTDSPRKNVDLVVRAREMMGNGAPAIKVVGTGSRPDQAGVEFLGFVDDARLDAMYRQARAVIAPSFSEGFDLPVIEALAAGTPVLASDIPVHREVLGDAHPYFFDPASPAQLAELMTIESPQTPDPTLLDRFSAEAVSLQAGSLLGLGNR